MALSISAFKLFTIEYKKKIDRKVNLFYLNSKFPIDFYIKI